MFLIKNETNHYLEFQKEGLVCFHHQRHRHQATKFKSYSDAEWALKKLAAIPNTPFPNLTIAVFISPKLRIVK